MKITLNLILLLFIKFSFSQVNTLKLSIDIVSDEKIESVYFRNFRGNIQHYFTEKTNLDFENELTEEYVFEVKLQDGLLRKRIWLDHGTFDIKISVNSKSLSIEVSGSEIFDNVAEYKTKFASLNSSNATDKEKSKFLFEQLHKNIGNPFSYIIGLNIMVKNQNNREVLFQLLSLINSQSESLKNHYTSELLFNELESRLNRDNIKLSEFTFLDQDYNERKISIEENEYVLLDFWHTTCPPCLKDHMELKTLAERFKEFKVKIVSVSIDQGERIETWKKYQSKENLPWANYREKETNRLTDNLSIRVFPTYILLDKNNDVVTYTNALSDIKTKLKIE